MYIIKNFIIICKFIDLYLNEYFEYFIKILIIEIMKKVLVLVNFIFIINKFNFEKRKFN